jgi:hypothetical protein
MAFPRRFSFKMSFSGTSRDEETALQKKKKLDDSSCIDVDEIAHVA